MAVKPLFTLICDDVRIETSNKLLVIGLYNYIINFQVPTTVVEQVAPGQGAIRQSPTPQFALPLLTLVRRWLVTEGGHRARTELIDPLGKTTPIADIELQVRPKNEPFQEVIRINGILLTPGVYTIRTTYATPGQHVYDEQFEVGVIGVPEAKGLVAQGPIQ
jgi:hypothetical protein